MLLLYTLPAVMAIMRKRAGNHRKVCLNICVRGPVVGKPPVRSKSARKVLPTDPAAHTTA
jgi:hypothetical protein